MLAKRYYSNFIHFILKKFLTLNETPIAPLTNPSNFLVVRQHNQLGDLLSGVSILRAIKEKYPQSKTTLIVSPVNYTGLVKNKFIDELFIFDKKKLLLPVYFFKLYKILKKQYDAAIVPVTVSVSFTSNLLCRFSKSLDIRSQDIVIGFHCGAGKKTNRWSLIKYVELMKQLNQDFNAKLYLTGSATDKEEISYILKNVRFKLGLFLNSSIPEVAALISKSTLFISNDTGIMHVAGTTNTSQISIFGPTDPFNWAPIGENKHYIRKSDLIDDVTLEDVYGLCKNILCKGESHLTTR